MNDGNVVTAATAGFAGPADPAAGARQLARLYDTLARWQWWRCRSARRRGELVELRKRLLPGDGERAPRDGGAGFDQWLQRRSGFHGGRVLDLGCGFGASLQRWTAAGGGAGRTSDDGNVGSEGVGITASRVQVRCANELAARHGASARLRFVAQDLGARNDRHFAAQDLAAPRDGHFAAVLAIESLGHARDLPAVLRGVRAALAPGGVFVWVEDTLAVPLEADADVAELAARWSSPPLRTGPEALAAARAAGLALVGADDLTAQVPARSLAELATARRRIERLRRWLPFGHLRALADAFLGGLALERLYARGLARYHAWRFAGAARSPMEPHR